MSVAVKESSWVYPRAGGGTRIHRRASGRGSGLSPRRRGIRRLGEHLPHRAGSIPAQAGEPIMSVAVNESSWVYPRAGGGTQPPIREA